MAKSSGTVVFVVGPRGYGERMEAAVSSLCMSSPVFQAMLQGPMKESDPYITIEDCDSRAFHCLLTWLQEGRLKLRSVSTALALLYLAHKYMVPDLVPPVLQYLIHNTTEDHVLPVLSAVLLYYRPPLLPSAPCLEGEEKCPSLPTSGYQQGLYDKLFYLCLSIIDKSASKVLDSEEWEDISRELLEIILIRNTLRLQSELEVARAVERWGQVQARRQGISRAEALGPCVYLIRFLAMSVQEYKRGVSGRGLLTSQEEQSLLFCLVRPGSWLPSHLDRMRVPLSIHRRWKRSKGRWWSPGRQPGPAAVKPASESERSFTLLEKIFLCLACIFD